VKCDSVEKRRSYRLFNITAYQFFSVKKCSSYNTNSITKKISGEGAQLLPRPPRGEGDTPSPHSMGVGRGVLDPRAYGTRPRPQGRLSWVLWAPSDTPVTEINP